MLANYVTTLSYLNPIAAKILFFAGLRQAQTERRQKP